jgi:hypothetical protein
LTNREKRREKIVRTQGVKPKLWVKSCASVAVLAVFLMGAIAAMFSK